MYFNWMLIRSRYGILHKLFRVNIMTFITFLEKDNLELNTQSNLFKQYG